MKIRTPSFLTSISMEEAHKKRKKNRENIKKFWTGKTTEEYRKTAYYKGMPWGK